jgi:hypothetical protein
MTGKEQKNVKETGCSCDCTSLSELADTGENGNDCTTMMSRMSAMMENCDCSEMMKQFVKSDTGRG